MNNDPSYDQDQMNGIEIFILVLFKRFGSSYEVKPLNVLGLIIKCFPFLFHMPLR